MSDIVRLSTTACVPLIEEPAPRANVKPTIQSLSKSAAGGFAALAIASSVLVATPPSVDAMIAPYASSTTVVAEKVIREGIYGEYEVDVQPQQYDDARSTFKPAKETKSKKGASVL